MALIIEKPPANLMAGAELAQWRDVPAAIISDELNRTGTMDAAIKPVRPGARFAAQALTVQCMVGDNAALHHGVPLAWPGAALVIDARGHDGTALWGNVLNTAAHHRGVAAVITDGAVRDLEDLRKSEIAVYARGVVPNGPHKGFGGAVNVPIQCGGAAVAPGDLLVGDDDGVVVIRPDQMAGLLDRCKARLAKEEEIVAKLGEGATTADLLNLPRPEDYA